MPSAELERSLRICAACMYCDALCPVFPKLADKRDYDPAAYNEALAFGRRNTIHWDDPELKKPRRGSRPK